MKKNVAGVLAEHIYKKNYDDINEFFWKRECLDSSVRFYIVILWLILDRLSAGFGLIFGSYLWAAVLAQVQRRAARLVGSSIPRFAGGWPVERRAAAGTRYISSFLPRFWPLLVRLTSSFCRQRIVNLNGDFVPVSFVDGLVGWVCSQTEGLRQQNKTFLERRGMLHSFKANLRVFAVRFEPENGCFLQRFCVTDMLPGWYSVQFYLTLFQIIVTVAHDVPFQQVRSHFHHF